MTHLFTYAPTTNEVVLNQGAGDALRAALGDDRADLSLSAPDSAGDHAHISVPILRAVARINGTTQVVQGTGSTAGGNVVLTDAAGVYRASATVGANGAFVIENVPAGRYELTLDASDWLTGWTNVTVPSTPSSPILTANIEARATAGTEPRQWPCDPIFPATYEGRPTSCTHEGIYMVPRGTAVLSLPIVASQPNNAAYGFPAGQRCEGLASWGQPYNHGTSSVRLYLDGQLLASRTMANCDMTSDSYGQTVSEQTLHVGSMTRDRDLVLRIVRSWTVDTSPFLVNHIPTTNIPGGLSVAADSQPTPRFAITSVTDRVGNAPIKLYEDPPGQKANDKFMGLPFDGLGTHAGVGYYDHRWRMRINYTPSNAQINAVRLFVVGPGLQEELSFDQSPASEGKLDLTNVRFPAAPHVLWHEKHNRLSIVVEIDGTAPDQPLATVRGELGLGTDHGPWRVTALYDAGLVPGALRYDPDREVAKGGDGWGVESALAFLERNPDVWFNDLSLEHGGYYDPHQMHRTGRSIDVRYFGSQGNADPMNGAAGENDQGVFRRNVVAAARQGNAAARQRLATWIVENRNRMNQILADTEVDWIYVGTEEWNWQSLMQGKYIDGNDIVNPQDNMPLGAWTPTGSVRRTGGHLSHAHIELKRKP